MKKKERDFELLDCLISKYLDDGKRPEGTPSCPDENLFVAFLEKNLPEAERVGVEAHLVSCRSCQMVMAALLKTIAAEQPHVPPKKPSFFEAFFLTLNFKSAQAVVATLFLTLTIFSLYRYTQFDFNRRALQSDISEKVTSPPAPDPQAAKSASTELGKVEPSSEGQDSLAEESSAHIRTKPPIDAPASKSNEKFASAKAKRVAALSEQSNRLEDKPSQTARLAREESHSPFSDRIRPAPPDAPRQEQTSSNVAAEANREKADVQTPAPTNASERSQQPDEIARTESATMRRSGAVAGAPPATASSALTSAAAPSALVRPTSPVWIGGNLLQSKLIKKVEPIYPEAAKRARVQGPVVLEVTVSEQGRVEQVKVVQGDPLLSDAAIQAVKQWVYSPILINGKPTAVIAPITLNFTLKD